MSQAWEYHQEIVPLHAIAEVCNKAAADGWKLHSTLSTMAQINGGLVTTTSGGMVQVAVLLFERKARAPQKPPEPSTNGTGKKLLVG